MGSLIRKNNSSRKVRTSDRDTSSSGVGGRRNHRRHSTRSKSRCTSRRKRLLFPTATFVPVLVSIIIIIIGIDIVAVFFYSSTTTPTTTYYYGTTVDASPLATDFHKRSMSEDKYLDSVLEEEEEEEENKEDTTDEQQYLEPDVRTYPKIMSIEDCQTIIKVGNDIGFPLEYDSIDANELEKNQNTFSQAMDIYDHGRILQPTLWEIIQPYIHHTADLILQQREDTVHEVLFPHDLQRRPQLGWIFMRKYSPSSDRNSLVPHTDTNVYTVNVALNHDFDGGGLFYVKPSRSLNPYVNQEKKQYAVPKIKEHQKHYEWVNSLRNNHHHPNQNNTYQNNPDIVFPVLEQGDVLIHNYTVWHAVAPLQHGTRYSLVLFFDMDNPMLEKEEDGEEDDMLEVEFRHQIQECVNGEWQFVPAIDILWINQGLEEQRLSSSSNNSSSSSSNNEEEEENKNENENEHHAIITSRFIVQTSIRPQQMVVELTDPNHLFVAVRSKQDPPNDTESIDDDDDIHNREILAQIIITEHQFSYEFILLHEQEQSRSGGCSVDVDIDGDVGGNNDNDNDNDNDNGNIYQKRHHHNNDNNAGGGSVVGIGDNDEL